MPTARPGGAVHGDSPDEALAEALRSGPFHLALRAAVRRRGLALHRIQHRLAEQGLRVSVTSLSYWQRGERVPARSESVQVVRALEGILGIVPGALVRLLEPVHGGTGGGTRAARRYQELIGPAAAVLRLLEQLDCPTEDRLHTVSQFEQVRVGRRRELWQREIQQFVRAHRGNVDRYVSIYEGDFGCDVTRVRIDPLDNCRLGRVRSDPASALLAAELVFDRPLALGETQPFRYRITDGTGGECTEYVRGFRYPVSHYLLQVSFAPPALPVRCYRFTRRASGAPRRRVVQVPLNGYHSTHLAEQELGPGIVGLGWEWD
ncbi:helix-turn-helix domain-containing protein [Streptomyces aculeolatus]